MEALLQMSLKECVAYHVCVYIAYKYRYFVYIHFVYTTRVPCCCCVACLQP